MDTANSNPAPAPAPAAAPPAAPAPAPRKTFDAVLFGPALQKGATHAARVNKACDLVEPFLGGQAFIRDCGGKFLATKSPHDKLLFAVDHDRAMECRYAWEDGPGGLKLGTLKAGA